MSDTGDDELLRRARELRDRANRRGDSRDDNAVEGGPLARPQALLIRLGRVLGHGLEALGPLGRGLIATFRALGRGLAWAAFRRSDGQFVIGENGLRQFSGRRLAAVTLLIVALGFALHMTVSALYFYSTGFTETVYVTGKQEIETGELYQFGGCISLPCSTRSDNGKFYLIESSLYFPTLLYPEEEVFANVPQQDGACAVTGYGIYFRSLRWLYKHAQLYQHVVDVSCRPYTEEEIARAVGSGRIIDQAGEERDTPEDQP